MKESSIYRTLEIQIDLTVYTIQLCTIKDIKMQLYVYHQETVFNL